MTAAGRKLLWGQDATFWTIARVRASGVAFIPENAGEMACIPGLSLRENLALGAGARYHAGAGIDWPRVDAVMAASFARLQVPMPPPGKPHHYNFTLYALKVPKLEVPEGASAALVAFNARAHALAEAKITGMYGR